MTKGHILTANRLSDGIVVFLGADNVWTTDIHNSALAQEEMARAALGQRGVEFETFNTVTGAYLVEAERKDGRVAPIHIRERIRATGPTVGPEVAREPCHVSL